MRYKSKQTGEIFDEVIFGRTKVHIPDWQKYFEPVYEVGDYSIIENKGLVQITHVMPHGNDIVFSYRVIASGALTCFETGSHDYCHSRPALPEEIRRANQKFLYEYNTGIPNKVIETIDPNQVEIQNQFNSIYLTKEAYQEIGKRKPDWK